MPPEVDFTWAEGLPPLTRPYRPDHACDDIPHVSRALDGFLNNRMLEVEEFCDKNDPDKCRLFFTAGYGLIQCAKAFMSYADDDMQAAIRHTLRGTEVANQHRRPPPSILTRLAGLITGRLSAQNLEFYESMTLTQLHAELAYAEVLFEHAMLGIALSGDWLDLIKEALHIKSAFDIFQSLGIYINRADKRAIERGDGPEEHSIDNHFRSGVYCGVGLSNIILSLLPPKLIRTVELFGYRGDRHKGLELLYRAGGWSEDKQDPAHEDGGLRRPACDLVLLVFHLVLSTLTFDGVDISMAQKILDWNLKRYPEGVFFLFAAGRLAYTRGHPRQAIAYHTKAITVQTQHRNLHHISYWEISIAYLALSDVSSSHHFWRKLKDESTWSQAIYTYALAVCLYELGEVEEASKLMSTVTSLRQKIAGKSIPLEKFVARKARKFISQGNRLTLPALELSHMFLGIAHAPREVVMTKMLPTIDAALDKFRAYEGDGKMSSYGKGKKEFWDDYCLARFLEGVCLRFVAYAHPDATADPDEKLSIKRADAETRAVEAFKSVFEKGPLIEYDHYIVYFAHYEFGRLLACMGDHEGARKQFSLVLSEKSLEVGPSGKNVNYSLQKNLRIRTFAALEALDKGLQRL